MTQRSNGSGFAQPLLLVGAAAGALLLWNVRSLLLLTFGGVLLAVLLSAVRNAITTHTPLPGRLGYPVTLLVVALFIAAVLAGIGARVSSELGQLAETLPQAAQRALASLPSGVQEQLEQLRSAGLPGGGNVLSRLAGIAGTTLGALADFVLVLFIGLFLAADPGRYRHGLALMLPKKMRGEAPPVLDAIGADLRQWLLGQLVSMTAVAVLVAAGLALLGVPMALALGLIAGLLEFIPFIGPIAGAVPGIIIAFSVGPQTALWAAVMYFAVQQVESQILTPLVQRWAVSLAPALTLAASVGFGLLFGPLGIIFGVPLAVAVKRLVLETWVKRQ